MKRARVLVMASGLGMAVAAGSVLLLADDAIADDKPGASPPKPVARADAGPAEKRYDPENTTGISRAMEALVLGNQRYVDKDYAGALELYKRGLALAPRNALAHYLVGETHLALKNPTEAEAAFKQAESLTDDRNPALRGRILFVIADFKERDRKVEEAKAAWKAYNEYAARFADAGVTHIKSGEERLRVLDDVTKLDKAYEIVRVRILAERDGGGADAAPKR
jgi:tetratricopeptide (TPR) repeat protein